MNKKAFIKKLWTIFRTDNTHDDIEEYAVICEALMAHNNVFFDAGTREWFYENINTEKAANDFSDFFCTAYVALDFTRTIQHA